MPPNGDDFYDGWVRDAEQRWRDQEATPEDKMLVVLANSMARQAIAIDGLTVAIRALPATIAEQLTIPETRGVATRLRQAAPPAGWLSLGAVLGYLADLLRGTTGK